MHVIEQFEVERFTVKIYRDEDALNPREDDNFGHIVAWHRRYWLGDKDQQEEFKTPESFEEWREEHKGEIAVILPVYLYDHSGIKISTGSFNDPWDSGQVGWTYCTFEDIRENWGIKHVSKRKIAEAEKLLRAEIDTFDQYLRGDVYGYVVKDSKGNNLDSCWGFFGLEYAKGEGMDAAKYEASKQQKLEESINRTFAL